MLKFFKTSKKLGKKFLTQYLIAAYLILLVSTIYSVVNNFNYYLERKRLEMEAAAYKIEITFSGLLDYTESVLNDFNHRIAASSSSKEQVLKIFETFRGEGDYYNMSRDIWSEGMFFWVDSKNKLLLSKENGFVKIPIDISKRDYLVNVKKTPWKIFTGASSLGAASGQDVIPMGVGVVKNNKYIGATVVGFRVENLVKQLSRVNARHKVNFAILDSNNKVLAESFAGMFTDNVKTKRLLQALPQDFNEGLVEDFVISEKKENCVILRKVEKYPYKILVASSNEKIFDDAYKTISSQISNFVMVTVFFAVMLYFVRVFYKK